MLEKTRMDECLSYLNEMIDTRVSSPMDISKQTKMDDASQNMGWYNDAWIVFLGTYMTMRCNVNCVAHD